MNNVTLVGRLIKDVEVTTSKNGKNIAKTTIAVQRDYKNAEGKYDSDFLNLIAFGVTGDFMAKYFAKGSSIAVIGKIQTGSYTNKDNQKVYTTDIVVSAAEFVGSKSGSNNNSKQSNSTEKKSNDGFMDIPNDIEEELPFR